MLLINNLNLANRVKALKLFSTYPVEAGFDSLDSIALKLYGSYHYWMYLAYYNDIVSPFGLISQGYTSIKIFSKSDLELLIS